MRVLFAALASPGHTLPMVPLALAVQAAGHDVEFAVGEAVHPRLRTFGLAAFRPADVFYEIYAEDLRPDLENRRPDLVVHGWGVPGAAEAAQQVGIRGVWHGFGRLFPDGIGLVRPTGTGRPHLDICPPSLQDKDFLATEATIPMRPGTRTPSTPDPGLVYLTLGTAFGSPDLLRTAIAGLAPAYRRVVVAAGRVTPAALGPLPANVTVETWVDQDAVLARAAAVVHHGGSGTTLGALAAGVPQLVLPQGADQFANAEAVFTAGAALRLTAFDAGTIREYAAQLDGCRPAAAALAREIAEMPAPARVAERLADDVS
ncbi:glycosyltransferase [Hamadaea tsunoensis]|uniref:glycosyltransferase n=1 Tax=Hamadaea tsunoensis TaxID=53368 RepID=UPI0004222C1F|nr:glycosyltransferase [Hamadaea tsunoensis]